MTNVFLGLIGNVWTRQIPLKKWNVHSFGWKAKLTKSSETTVALSNAKLQVHRQCVLCWCKSKKMGLVLHWLRSKIPNTNRTNKERWGLTTSIQIFVLLFFNVSTCDSNFCFFISIFCFLFFHIYCFISTHSIHVFYSFF